MTPTRKLPTSYRLSGEGRDLLEKLAEQSGVSQTAVLEALIRQEAWQKGISVKFWIDEVRPPAASGGITASRIAGPFDDAERAEEERKKLLRLPRYRASELVVSRQRG